MNTQLLNKLNKDIMIKDISDPSLSRYGYMLPFSMFQTYANYLHEHTTIPQSFNEYVADDPNIHKLFHADPQIYDIFNNEPLQFGYVNGNNSLLNALEFHPSAEINIAVTPLVLMLGHTQDIKDLSYDVKKLEAFYVPAHTAIVIYPTTLHFSPCKVSDQGFKCGVLLPYGTNMSFVTKAEKERLNDPLLYKTHKWLLAHPDHQKAIDLGAYPGLKGKNIKIEYK